MELCTVLDFGVHEGRGGIAREGGNGRTDGRTDGEREAKRGGSDGGSESEGIKKTNLWLG